MDWLPSRKHPNQRSNLQPGCALTTNWTHDFLVCWGDAPTKGNILVHNPAWRNWPLFTQPNNVGIRVIYAKVSATVMTCSGEDQTPALIKWSLHTEGSFPHSPDCHFCVHTSWSVSSTSEISRNPCSLSKNIILWTVDTLCSKRY